MSDECAAEPVRPSLPLEVGLLLVLLGTTWAGFFAAQSDSWNTACYEVNICDSLTFRVVGELLDEGLTPYDSKVRREHVSRTRLSGDAVPFDLPFQYPPNSLPIFVLRSWSSPFVSHIGFSTATTFGFLLLMVQLVRQNVIDRTATMFLIGGIACSAIVAFNAQLGQTGALAAALVVGAVVLWQKSPTAAGLLLGALMFKPQYAIPLLSVALLRGHWRICAGAFLCFLGFTVLSGIAFGFSQWNEFFGVLGQTNYTVPFMVNWMGLAWRLFPGSQLIHEGALPVFAMAMAVLTGVLWVTRDRISLDAQLSIAIVLALVASPNTHPYDLLVLGPTLAYLAATEGGLLVGLFFFLVTWRFLPPPQRWILTVAIILLGAACVHTVWRRGPTADDGPRVEAGGGGVTG